MRWSAIRVFLVVAGILLVNLHLAVRQGDFALPMTVSLEGFSEHELANARLRVVGLGHDQIVAATRAGYWDCPHLCTEQIILWFAEPLQQEDKVVHVHIGEKAFTLRLSELESENGFYWFPDSVTHGPTPSFAICRNWPGMAVFAGHYARRTAPGLLAFLFLMLVVWCGMHKAFRSHFEAIIGMAAPSPSTAANGAGRCWNLVGWVFLIGGFAALEYRTPYYFTQDDALVGELPGILLGCRSLWQGTFPDWNPYVLLGAPLATTGFWSITYPPQWLSYAIARHVLGDEYATMEVFAALHLVVGFVAMRHLCRRIGMSAGPANLSALSFVFSGCILIMGRSWHAFVANAVWLPLLGIAIQRYREGPVGWKWIIGVGLVLGLAYHAGFPQIVAILGMFFVIGLAVVTFGDRIPLRRLAASLPALLLGVGLSAPLLLHQLQMIGGHERFVPVENGIYDELPGALLPYPLAQAALPTHWGGFHFEKMGHFYFFGGLFALLFALQALSFWVHGAERRAWARSWWVPSGMIALLLVLGEPAYLWKGMAALPLSKIFLRYTFRFYPWLAFCAILSGGLILDRVLAAIRWPISGAFPNAAWSQAPRRVGELLLGSLMLGVLAYHVTMCQAGFYSYGFSPYPELPQEFEAVFHPYADKPFVGAKNSGRLASWTQLRSVSPDFFRALPLNLPDCYQVPSLFGYDPIVEGQPRMVEVQRRLLDDPVATYKAYGVAWHVFGNTDAPVLSPNKAVWSTEKTINWEPAYRRLPKGQLAPLAAAHGATLMELPGVDPLAFVAGQPSRPLPLRLSCRGADINVADLPPDTTVTINFLWHPWMKVTLDGQPLPVAPDDWQRVTAHMVSSGSTLSLRFEPPWLKTCAAGAGLSALALALAWLTLRSPERQS